MEIYRSDYVKVYYDDKLSLIEQEYTGKTFTDSEFVKEHKQLLELIRKIRPEKFLVNLTKNDTRIGTKNEVWLTDGIMPEAMKSGLEKMAFIVKDEFNSPVEIEQVAEIESNRILVPQYFDDMEIAKEWLLDA